MSYVDPSQLGTSHLFGPLAPWLEADLNASLARRIIGVPCLVLNAHPWGLGSNLLETWMMITMAQATQPELRLHYNHQQVRELLRSGCTPPIISFTLTGVSSVSSH